ncbi:MAG TPA: FAD-dependent thymidylate synthase [Candidatus Nanoarchaeia archaeon]|nr:FAD-dependent thymidylate synthase [Candidatus Nanoarchaeia archaeon]
MEQWSRKINVLDKGFVRLVDVMGSDDSIVQAARVSYGAGTKKVSEDKGLIKYLYRHGHTSPFEMVEMKFHVKVPMDCWRQWIRHRTANVNEYSTRYSLAIDEKQETAQNQWRVQAQDNKQGSAGKLEDINPILAHNLSKDEKNFQAIATRIYNERIEAGVAKEQARKDLPLSTYTEAYWKIDLHNLFNFLRLRLDSHAQYEIHQYALAIAEFVKEEFPISWSAFEEYELYSLKLFQKDYNLIQMIIAEKYTPKDIFELATEFGWLSYVDNSYIKVSRELDEFESKLKLLGISSPFSKLNKK